MRKGILFSLLALVAIASVAIADITGVTRAVGVRILPTQGGNAISYVNPTTNEIWLAMIANGDSVKDWATASITSTTPFRVTSAPGTYNTVNASVTIDVPEENYARARVANLPPLLARVTILKKDASGNFTVTANANPPAWGALRIPGRVGVTVQGETPAVGNEYKVRVELKVTSSPADDLTGDALTMWGSATCGAGDAIAALKVKITSSLSVGQIPI